MVCAASMRSTRGTLASPKCPTPKVIDQTTARATTNAAAAANTGRQRTITQSRTGNTSTTGTAVAQGPCGNEITKAHNAANIESASAPSTDSRRAGTRRLASASPTRSGATVTMPSRQEANQTRHTMVGDDVACKSSKAIVAPKAATAAPIVLAIKKPRTWRTSLSSNDLPNQCSINPVVRSA